jgi:hypothetical protein
MPTNRTRRTRTRHAPLEQWQKEYLLYGWAKHSTLPNRKSILPLCDGGALCDFEVWHPVWERHKAELLREFRREHPNCLCWAESELRKMELGT